MIDLFYILGIAMCVGVLLQMCMWISSSLIQISFNRQQLDASREIIKQQIELTGLRSKTEKLAEQGRWSGYREFYVERLEKNAEMITSLYLKPVDEKPIASFKAGQYLSVRFNLPGESKPLVRCYSLSMGPGKDYYRISVKTVAPPPGKPDLPPGKVSSFINQNLIVGDQIEVKAPAGSFYLNDKGDSPVVLLAGGIGITPMMSMLDDLVRTGSRRLIVLFYGVRCGREHAFKDCLKQVANDHENVHVVTCYSDPESSDKQNTDYHVHGFVSVDLIKRLLPNNQCRYYLCGPPPFMESIRNGLLEWEVPEERINFEAFCPATIKKAVPKDDTVERDGAVISNVRFSETGKTVTWSSDCDSILELAESNDILIDSGCRAGSCQTCAIPLVHGSVLYPDGMQADCAPGMCLPCIAKPNGEVELDA